VGSPDDSDRSADRHGLERRRTSSAELRRRDDQLMRRVIALQVSILLGVLALIGLRVEALL
jgi:hypothetical protein